MKELLVFMFISCFFVMALVAVECGNVHCRFEYLGHRAVANATEADFLSASAVSGVYEHYFESECRPFRKLNWHLNKFEQLVYDGDHLGCSNAVWAVAGLLTDYALFFRSETSREKSVFPRKLRMLMLEKIEYSAARLILDKKGDIVGGFLDKLLPDSMIDEDHDFSSWHSIRTFKNMLFIACAIENYSNKEGCYPLNLRQLELPEQIRKCACGRDIDYEYHNFCWILRSRCESLDGGLEFDEYIPTIYCQRKKLDLCFSPSYNRKRRMLYDGEGMDTNDIRLTGFVNHDVPWSGVHLIKFMHPSAGNMRIVPLSGLGDKKE